MKLAEAVAANTLVFDVEVPSQGLILGAGVPTDAKIKVDLVQKDQNDVTRIPELPLQDVFDINRYLGFDKVLAFSTLDGEFTQRNLVFFSASGVLVLDEDTKYRVTLSNLGGSSFEVHNVDNARLGMPLVIKKSEVRGTQSEKLFNFLDVDFLLFNGAHEPEKLTYLVNDKTAKGAQTRKVEVSNEQMQALKQAHEFSGVDSDDGSISNTVQSIGFPISKIDALTVHHDASLETDMTFLTVDYTAQNR